MAESSKPDRNKAGSNNCAGSAKEDCPLLKWIKVTMTRKKRDIEKVTPQMAKTNKKRNIEEEYPWWPSDVILPYSEMKYEMELTNGNKKGKLNSQGSTEFNNIPPGACSFKCQDFYSEIEAWIIKTLK